MPDHRSSRGAQMDPPNRFAAQYTVKDIDREPWEEDDERPVPTQVLVDHARSILTKNSSPDIGFDYSVNPYRGCEHGCAYCYARPSHETLSFNAGIDFETRIMVKQEAPKLLREALLKPAWKGEPIALSGITDCYQPLEKTYRLTRACLEVLWEFRNPVTIISKNILMLRDLDILQAMAEQGLVHVFLSITSLDKHLARKLEPRTPPPDLRLQALKRMADAGIPVGVNAAPMIPGLTDKELPRILEAAAAAGARSAGWSIVRLPLAVKPIFLDWLDQHVPLRAQHVKTLLQDVRQGELSDARFGTRQSGEGSYAEQLQTIFRIFSRKYGLDQGLPELNDRILRRPGTWIQRELFPHDGV